MKKKHEEDLEMGRASISIEEAGEALKNLKKTNSDMRTLESDLDRKNRVLNQFKEYNVIAVYSHELNDTLYLLKTEFKIFEFILLDAGFNIWVITKVISKKDVFDRYLKLLNEAAELEPLRKLLGREK